MKDSNRKLINDPTPGPNFNLLNLAFILGLGILIFNFGIKKIESCNPPPKINVHQQLFKNTIDQFNKNVYQGLTNKFQEKLYHSIGYYLDINNIESEEWEIEYENYFEIEKSFRDTVMTFIDIMNQSLDNQEINRYEIDENICHEIDCQSCSKWPYCFNVPEELTQ